MCVWFISIYALFATLAIIMMHRHESKESIFLSEVCDSIRQELEPSQRLQAILDVKKIRQTGLPWFERSSSTVGVALFFSMLIAAGVEVVKSSADAVRAEQLQREVKELGSQKVEFEKSVADLSDAIVSQYRETASIDDSGVRVLRARLNYIKQNSNLTRDQITEAFNISVITGDYKGAAHLLKGHADLLDRTKTEDLIALAEYYFLTADSNSGRAMLTNLDGVIGTAPVSVRKRAIVMNAILRPDGQDYAAEFAAILHLDREGAERRLELEKEKMRAAAGASRSP